MKEPRATLRAHQTKAISELDVGKILVGGTGSGKTMTALGYYVANQSPKDIYVITTARKRNEMDWENEASYFHIDTETRLDHGLIHVDSWNNIKKYEDVEDAFFIFDEQRLVGSGAWVKAFYKIAKKNDWIMLSATPGDTWMDYAPVMIANGYFKNKTDFVTNHVVYKPYTKFPQIDRYVTTGKLLRIRRDLLVEMPYEYHTTRHTEIINVSYDKELMRKVMKERWNFLEERPIRNVSELYSLSRRVVNSDDSRISALDALTRKHDRLIVFYNFDYELELLRELCEGRVYAEWNGHKHQPVPEGRQWVYLVQYAAGAEAWNCITTDALCFFSRNYSYKVTMQAFGRIDRMNTPYVDLYYYFLESTGWIDKAIKKSFLDKKDFNIIDDAKNRFEE